MAFPAALLCLSDIQLAESYFDRYVIVPDNKP